VWEDLSHRRNEPTLRTPTSLTAGNVSFWPSRHIVLPHELGRYWSKADVVTSHMSRQVLCRLVADAADRPWQCFLEDHGAPPLCFTAQIRRFRKTLILKDFFAAEIQWRREWDSPPFPVGSALTTTAALPPSRRRLAWIKLGNELQARIANRSKAGGKSVVRSVVRENCNE